MVRDVTPNRLLVWWLRVRSAWGWGASPSSLRRLSRVTRNQWKAILIFELIVLAFVCISTQAQFAGQPSHLTALNESSRLILNYLWPQALLLGFCLALNSIIAHMLDKRATKAARQPNVTRAGFCFSTVISQTHGLFALVGPMRQRARWFRMPLDWDVLVEPGADYYLLTYNPITGYVEQVERQGTQPQARSRAADEPAEQEGAAAADTAGNEATPDERRELKRLARSAGVGWGVDSAGLPVSGAALAIGGLALMAIPFVLLAIRGGSDGAASGDAPTLLTLALLDSLCVIPGVVLGAQAMRVVRAWAHLRGATTAPSEVAEGIQVCWTPYGDWFANGGDMLVAVQVADGEQLLFRVPGYFMHRVRQVSAGVRVTYNALSWRVLDYRPLPASA